MYELVLKILDTSRDKDVDVLVAYDMVAHEIGYTDELKNARNFIKKYYYTITKCRRAKDNESIKILCDLVAEGNIEKIRNFEEEIENR